MLHVTMYVQISLSQRKTKLARRTMKTRCVSFLCLALVLLVQGQDNPDFISIDCGAPNDYHDNVLNISYKTDTGFVDSGQAMQVPSNLIYNNMQQLKNLRSFPNGTRNCYTLQPQQGEKKKYLIRATFFYGNYDNKGMAPVFDLHVDTNYWAQVNSPNYTWSEIIYVAPREYIQVCLVNTGKGTPFISALELRLLDSTTYQIDSGALVTCFRLNIGSSITFRHPQDDYDRIWSAQEYANLTSITNTTVFDLTTGNDAYDVPAEVLMSAQQSSIFPGSMIIYWSSDPNQTWYIVLHFAEIQVLQPGHVREFAVYMEGVLTTTLRPQYSTPATVVSLPITGPTVINFSLDTTSQSTLPPIINAAEVFNIIGLPISQTALDDVNAMVNIEISYAIERDSWQGDPCAPQDYLWKGLNCTYSSPPRIISLNLSSSMLKGGVSNSFSNLTALVTLDLAYNGLSGPIPTSFAQMPSLQILNLSNNNLSGVIPHALIKKMVDGTLKLSVDGNPYLSQVYVSENKKKWIVPVSVSSSIFALIFVCSLVIIIWRTKRKRQGVNAREPNEGRFEMIKKRPFQYDEVLRITDNFSVVIGEGGFGKVYLGTLDDGCKVAVKLLSQSSRQGHKEFQAEAGLLMIVYHRSLVSLIGYCDDSHGIALIYEFMYNGNLKNLLSEQNANVLSWSQRLNIAIDAAQGLEYLHFGCKPPIIHRDLKTSNILLNEHMQAKIADFGLSKAFATDQDSYISTQPAGTPGYLDPEFQSSGNLTLKSDVYSFGIILLELITSRPAIIRSLQSNTHIIQWVTPLIDQGDLPSIVDQRLQGQFSTESVWKAVDTAMSCVSLTSMGRPDIKHVLSELKECLSLEANASESFELTSSEFDLAPRAR